MITGVLLTLVISFHFSASAELLRSFRQASYFELWYLQKLITPSLTVYRLSADATDSLSGLKKFKILPCMLLEKLQKKNASNNV